MAGAAASTPPVFLGLHSPTANRIGGSVWESNPPGTLSGPRTPFEAEQDPPGPIRSRPISSARQSLRQVKNDDEDENEDEYESACTEKGADRIIGWAPSKALKPSPAATAHRRSLRP